MAGARRRQQPPSQEPARAACEKRARFRCSQRASARPPPQAGALGARYATMPAGKFWALCFAQALVNGGAMAVAARPLKRILSAPLPAVGAADRGAAEGEGEELGTL